MVTEPQIVLPPEEPAMPCPLEGSATVGDLILNQAATIRCERAERRKRRAWREEAARAPRQED